MIMFTKIKILANSTVIISYWQWLRKIVIYFIFNTIFYLKYVTLYRINLIYIHFNDKYDIYIVTYINA